MSLKQHQTPQWHHSNEAAPPPTPPSPWNCYKTINIAPTPCIDLDAFLDSVQTSQYLLIFPFSTTMAQWLHHATMATPSACLWPCNHYHNPKHTYQHSLQHAPGRKSHTTAPWTLHQPIIQMRTPHPASNCQLAANSNHSTPTTTPTPRVNQPPYHYTQHSTTIDPCACITTPWHPDNLPSANSQLPNTLTQYHKPRYDPTIDEPQKWVWLIFNPVLKSLTNLVVQYLGSTSLLPSYMQQSLIISQWKL